MDKFLSVIINKSLECNWANKTKSNSFLDFLKLLQLTYFLFILQIKNYFLDTCFFKLSFFSTYTVFYSKITKQKEQRMSRPNFQYGKSTFGRIGSTKKAAQKSPIMNSEQLFRAFFSCFHGQKFIFLELPL